jgi:Trypsin
MMAPIRTREHHIRIIRGKNSILLLVWLFSVFVVSGLLVLGFYPMDAHDDDDNNGSTSHGPAQQRQRAVQDSDGGTDGIISFYEGDRPPNNNNNEEEETAEAEARVFNGTDAVEGRFPYYVALYDKNDNFRCGGSLIAPNIVLSAAHCQCVSYCYCFFIVCLGLKN